MIGERAAGAGAFAVSPLGHICRGGRDESRPYVVALRRVGNLRDWLPKLLFGVGFLGAVGV
ncbi:MAG: hypothetical protein K2N91_02970, partial [Muribaculaceae bacterium]|nr:hypothetical protein [Muribaculaceae bacterium]